MNFIISRIRSKLVPFDLIKTKSLLCSRCAYRTLFAISTCSSQRMPEASFIGDNGDALNKKEKYLKPDPDAVSDKPDKESMLPTKFVSPALSFEIIAQCSTSKARVSKITLPHSCVDAPVFMPVGTKGTLKGILPEQLKSLGCQIMLSNTYHLGNQPGEDIVDEAGGLHKFMNWDRSILTDSGGFQMVSLVDLCHVTEEGVSFKSPYKENEVMMMSPEKSIQIQTLLGADIMMQLDDVVHVSTIGDRVEEAMWRSIRWLDRCIAAHKNVDKQNLFAIIQGGLDDDLRVQCCQEMTKRDQLPGFAIGGLSGGEDKAQFWRTVNLSTDHLPNNKPRYCMGVGYAVDLIVCVALGVDMFDCVFPTRTARFGVALSKYGFLKLTTKMFKDDLRPIEDDCQCSTCKNYSRAFLNDVATHDPNACTLISIHNVAYQLNLMKSVRQAIIEDRFPQFVNHFMQLQFQNEPHYPQWVVEALQSVNIKLVKEDCCPPG